MSVDQHIALAQRKERLFARIETERERLASYGALLDKPFAAADKIIQAGRYIKERPWIAGLGVLSMVLLGRRRLLSWAGRGWMVWRGWRFAKQWLRQAGIMRIQ